MCVFPKERERGREGGGGVGGGGSRERVYMCVSVFACECLSWCVCARARARAMSAQSVACSGERGGSKGDKQKRDGDYMELRKQETRVANEVVMRCE